MRSNRGVVAAFVLLAAPIVAAAGCLSLGGTTYTGNAPETEGRLSALEGRVSHLEQMMHGTATPTAAPMPAPSY